MNAFIKQAFFLLFGFIVLQTNAQISIKFYSDLPLHLRPANIHRLTDNEISKLLDSLHQYPVNYNEEVKLLGWQLKNKAEQNKEPAIKIKLYKSLAFYYDYTYQYDSSLFFCRQILNIAAKIPGYSKDKLFAYTTMSVIFLDIAKYDSSITYGFKGLSNCEQLCDTAIFKSIYEALSDCYSFLGQFDQAINYIHLALKLCKTQWNDEYNYFYLHKVKFYIREFESNSKYANADSIKFLIKNFFSFTQNRSQYWYGAAYYFLGRFYFINKQYKKALTYFDSSLLPKYAANDRYYGYNSKLKRFYCKLSLVGLGNYKIGKQLLDSLESKDIKLKKTVCKELYEFAEKNGIWKDAFFYHKKFRNYSDSLKITESNILISLSHQNYFIKEKEAEIKTLEVKNLLREKEKTKIKSLSIIIGLILVIIISVLIGMSLHLRMKNARERQHLLTELFKMEDFLHNEMESQSLKILEQRKKIAADLHDEVSSGLAAFRYLIADLKNKSISFETLSVLEDLEAESVVLYQTSRDFLKKLNVVEASVEGYNVYELAKNMAKRFDDTKMIRVRYEIDHEGVGYYFTASMHYEMYLVLKEALANSVKYSGASLFSIRIYFKDHICFFSLEDNGKGFDLNNVTSDGFGLKSMKSRIKNLNGIIRIHSDKNGTTINGSFKV